MSEFPDRLLRISDVARATGATPKAIQHWIQRGKVDLSSETTGGWRSFTLEDVAVLALVRVFVDFGIAVETANRLAHEALAMFPKAKGDLPVRALALPWTDRALAVWPDGVSWRLQLIDYSLHGGAAEERLIDEDGQRVAAFLKIEVVLVLSHALVIAYDRLFVRASAEGLLE
jgi:DNA-binding transcriptional MerR regulator